MVDEFLINMVLWFVGLFLLYWVIKGAIDNSETARNIKEVKKLLRENNKNNEI